MRVPVILSIVACFFTATILLSQQTTTVGPKPAIAYCAKDGSWEEIPDWPATGTISQFQGFILRARFMTKDNGGAQFSFARQGKTALSFRLKDLYNPDIWITRDPDSHTLALQYSDGGGLGGWHVRVFQVGADDAVIDISNALDGAIRDFRSRHYCKARGNNYQALKWIKGDLLLFAEVYPTGDCGPDLGHIEGYLVSVSDGTIKEHLTLDQLRKYPGVCLQNETD